MAHAGMDTVGADQQVGFGRSAVLEADDHAIALFFDIEQTMAGMGAILRHRFGKQKGQVAAMEMIVGCTEALLDFRAQRRALQRATVVPALLVDGERSHAPALHRVPEAQPMQQARGVGADLQAGADLAEARRLLVDLNVESGLEQRQRRGQPADATADDGHA